MRKLLFFLLVLNLALLMPVGLTAVSHAATAPVQFSIPDTKLTIQGFASPNAFVQIFDDDVLIGTLRADRSGRFEKAFPAMKAGLHRIRIIYEDADGLVSDPLAQTINVRAQSDTAVEYYLPPTIRVRPVSVVEGELVTFSGSSLPNAKIRLSLDGGSTILEPQTDANGRYTISVDTSNFYLGEHTFAANASLGGFTSLQTIKRSFIVLPVGSVDNNADSGKLTPPVITEGTQGEIETDRENTLIRGIGPPNTQIIIYIDGEPVGSTFTNSDGEWFFNINITKEIHIVRAVSCFSNQCSDFSNELTVTFTGQLGACSVLQFYLNDYRYFDVRERDGINLEITSIGGTPPYEIQVDWGDETTQRFDRDSSEGFNIHHVYNLQGNFNGELTIVDDNDCELTRYFTVQVVERSLDARWLAVIGPTLLLLLLALRRRHHVHHKKLILAR